MITEKSKFKTLIISIFLLSAIIYNSPNFLVFFYNVVWNLSFYQKNYWLATIYHWKAYNKLWNEVLNYNLWWDYYELWKFDKSMELYSKINLFTGSNLSLDTYYNLWNIFYRLWDSEQYDIQKKVDLWKKSLLSYNQVLLKKEDKQTRENYNFVQKKLNELLQKIKEEQQKQIEEQQKQQEEQQKQNENKNNDENNNDSESTSQWQKDQNNEQKDQQDQVQTVKWWRGDEYKLWNWQELQELTPSEKEELQKYNEQLKQEQQQNSIYFGKKNQDKNNTDSLINQFMQDPFFNDFKSFDNSILNKNEKDW